MNFYRHYIGDFQRDTGHLSLAERGAYRAIMDHYYAREEGPKADLDFLCRIAGATTSAERKAVKTAMEMFETRDGRLWHKRVEAELVKAADRSDTNREIALAREAKKRADKEHEQPHDQSTIRAPDVAPDEHGQSTKPLTINQQEAKKQPRKRACVPCPPDFAISERVRKWAISNGHSQLEKRFEQFMGYVRRKAPTYADWDEAFMGAVREDWAKLGNSNGTEVYGAPVLQPGQWN